jgi:hypothetical protein
MKIIQVINGEKINGPTPFPDIMMPMTRPRRYSNHRVISVVVDRKKALRPADATKPYQK